MCQFSSQQLLWFGFYLGVGGGGFTPCFNTTSEPPCAIGLRPQEFDFKLEYELGLNNIADVLSRKPFFDTTKINEAEHFVNYTVSNSIPKTLTFHEIREAT